MLAASARLQGSSTTLPHTRSNGVRTPLSTAEGGRDANRRSYRLRPSRRLAYQPCLRHQRSRAHAAPDFTATERIVDYRLIDGRFFAFMAANCRDLDVKLASSRRETVMKGIEACWNRFNPEI